MSRMPIGTAVILAAAAGWLPCAPVRAGDLWFATRVVEYRPAQGQFVNLAQYNDATRALGAPTGGGTVNPDNSGVVTLGGFGGQLVLGFDRPIVDDPQNAFGLDFIVFGNASYVSGNANRRFAECSIVEVSRDDNSNGLADDAWFVIPGSHLAAPLSQHLHTVIWDNDVTDSSFPPAQASWLPPGVWAAPPVQTWSTAGYQLPTAVFGASAVLSNPNGITASVEGVWGYMDHTPTLLLGDMDGNNTVDDPEAAADVFYATPDDPMLVGISPGSGGGDGIDIAWAVNPVTGMPAALDRIDFVRMTNPVDALLGPVGEWSAEIDAVSIVRPTRHPADIDGNGTVGVPDIFAFLTLWFAADVRADVDGVPGVGVPDIFAFLSLWFAA